MHWSDFYENYIDWTESTIASRISSLEDAGKGSEILEVIYELYEEKNKDKLIRKAIRLNAAFSQTDFIELEGEVSDAVYKELGEYTGFNPENPTFDENNLGWDAFCVGYLDWSEQDVLRRIAKLKSFGSADEVCEAILLMPNDMCKFALAKKAISAGVRFNKEQLWDMEIDSEGNDNSKHIAETIESQIDALFGVSDVEEPEPCRTKIGFFGTILAVLGAFGGSRRGHDRDKCNDSPPHYGYRYGRWYYGRGHRHGCQKGGNGRHPKRTAKD